MVCPQSTRQIMKRQDIIAMASLPRYSHHCAGDLSLPRVIYRVVTQIVHESCNTRAGRYVHSVNIKCLRIEDYKHTRANVSSSSVLKHDKAKSSLKIVCVPNHTTTTWTRALVILYECFDFFQWAVMTIARILINDNSDKADNSPISYKLIHFTIWLIDTRSLCLQTKVC